NPLYASYDVQGNMINDLYATEFPSGGFDLDAVAVMNESPLSIATTDFNVSLFPNPTSDVLTIETADLHTVEIYSIQGQRLDTLGATKKRTLSLKKYASSIVILRITTSSGEVIKRVQVL